MCVRVCACVSDIPANVPVSFDHGTERIDTRFSRLKLCPHAVSEQMGEVILFGPKDATSVTQMAPEDKSLFCQPWLQ